MIQKLKKRCIFETVIILILQWFCVSVYADKAALQGTAATTEQLVLLRSIDQKYQKADSVQMRVFKRDTISALEQVREFEGQIILQKGKFRLEVVSKDNNKDESLVVADGTTLWFVTPPPKEFKGAKTQVLKASLTTDKAKSQSLLRLLTEGGVLKQFTVTGVQDLSQKIIYSLKPDKKSSELSRAEVTVDKEKQILMTLKYWDKVDNQTEYEFSAVEFNKNIDKKRLTYTPPKNADVVSYK